MQDYYIQIDFYLVAIEPNESKKLQIKYNIKINVHIIHKALILGSY